MNSGPGEEFLPSADDRTRRAARQRTETRARRWGLIGGAFAAAAIVVLVIALTVGGDDAPKHAADTGRTRRTTTTTRVRRSTTTTTTEALPTTTSTTPPGAEVGPGPGSSTQNTDGTPPETGAPADPTQGGVTVSETPGACRYNPDTSEVEDSGTVSNPGSEDATVEVEVTWSDSTGEFDSWSDVVGVPANGTADWSVSTAWVDAPQGLTCQTALI